MATERRQQVLLGVLALVLAAAAYRAWPRTSGGRTVASNGKSGTAASASRGGKAEDDRPEVHLTSLEAGRPKPSATGRNAFQFKERAPAPATPPERASRPAVPAPAEPSGPPPPAPPPPIALKFIGIVEASERSQKLAVLSDGRNVFHGAEGGIIEGRYRILKIGTESIELAYLDGRGRQTIRLSGS